jgi:hypothetical protein
MVQDQLQYKLKYYLAEFNQFQIDCKTLSLKRVKRNIIHLKRLYDEYLVFRDVIFILNEHNCFD